MRRSYPFSRSALAVAILAGLTAGLCVDRATPAHAAGTLAIGVVADLTGQGAAYGVSIANGARLAGQVLNKDGGVNGTQVNVIVDDAGSVNSQVINLFQ